MIKLIDVINNKENKDILDKFIKKILIQDDHRNIRNYKFLLETEDLKTYYHRFTMIMSDEEVVSIQGIRHSPNNYSYPTNICRICDRHYVNMKYRANYDREPYYTKYCLKSDIEYLKENHLEVDTVFVSMEGTRGHKFFKRKTLDLYKDQGFNFCIDNKFYQTCNSIKSKTCWQACVYYNIRGGNHKLDLPSINYEEWIGKE